MVQLIQALPLCWFDLLCAESGCMALIMAVLLTGYIPQQFEEPFHIQPSSAHVLIFLAFSCASPQRAD